MQSAGWDAKLPHKKMKTLFLSNMSKSRRRTSTFFPTRLKTRPDTRQSSRGRLGRGRKAIIAHNSKKNCREKSRSQSSTFWHIWEKHGFHFLMGKFRLSIDRMWPPMKKKKNRNLLQSTKGRYGWGHHPYTQKQFTYFNFWRERHLYANAINIFQSGSVV